MVVIIGPDGHSSYSTQNPEVLWVSKSLIYEARRFVVQREIKWLILGHKLSQLFNKRQH